MFTRILVPLDGAARAERALPIAARLAKASHGSVVLVQVVTPPVDYGGHLSQGLLITDEIVRTLMDEAHSYLSTVALLDELEGVPTTTRVVFGSSVQEIFAVALDEHADLIVMCSHGRTGFKRWALGSVAHKLVHQSPIPVLVLRDGEPLPISLVASTPRPLSALVALDGSALAETALMPAANLVADLSAPNAGTLHLCQVVPALSARDERGFMAKIFKETVDSAKAYLTAIQERLSRPKLKVTWSVAIDNDVADTLIGTAEHSAEVKGLEAFSNCDLIAISTHGRDGLQRLVMGSITERVLNASKVPVLVVRPTATEIQRMGEKMQAEVQTVG